MSVDQPIPKEDEEMSDIDDCLKSVEDLTRDRGEVMRAGNDYYRIEKIQARHAEAEIALRGAGSLRKVHPHDAPEWAMYAHDDRAALLAEVERMREALIEWDALIQHQYSGSRDAMTDMQYAIFRTRQILDELDAPDALEAKP